MLDREFTAGWMTATTRRRIVTLTRRTGLPACTASECGARLGRDRPQLRANSRSSIYARRMADDARERIQKLLVTGDNRLKQGVALAKVRESYEEALVVAREAGLEDAIRPLVEIRLADLVQRAEESPPPVPPAA
jgi:hypothetical protein